MADLTTLNESSVPLVQSELNKKWDIIAEDPEVRAELEKALLAAEMDISVDAWLQQTGTPYEAKPEREGSGTGIIEAILVKTAVTVGSAILVKTLEYIWKEYLEEDVKKRFPGSKDSSSDT